MSWPTYCSSCTSHAFFSIVLVFATSPAHIVIRLLMMSKIYCRPDLLDLNLHDVDDRDVRAVVEVHESGQPTLCIASDWPRASTSYAMSNKVSTQGFSHRRDKRGDRDDPIDGRGSFPHFFRVRR